MNNGVDAAVRCDRTLHQGMNLLRIVHVSPERSRFAPICADSLDNAPGNRFISQIGNHDIPAAGGKPLCDHCSNTSATPGHQCNASQNGLGLTLRDIQGLRNFDGTFAGQDLLSTLI